MFRNLLEVSCNKGGEKHNQIGDLTLSWIIRFSAIDFCEDACEVKGEANPLNADVNVEVYATVNLKTPILNRKCH